jgi:hypothetical protein
MGQVMSGDLAGGTLYSLAEEAYADLDFIQTSHNIHMYARYRDDICIVYSQPRGCRKALTFIKKMITLSRSIYKVTCDSIAESCDFLDVTLYKPDHFMQSGIIAFRPFVEPTAQKVPLASTSLHDPSIHTAWPLAEVKRMHKRSSTYKNFCTARRALARKFAYIFMSPGLVRSIERCCPHTSTAPKSNQDSDNVWVPIPYRPQVYDRLKATLHKTIDAWVSKGFHMRIRPQLCWQRAGMNLGDTLKKLQGV